VKGRAHGGFSNADCSGMIAVRLRNQKEVTMIAVLEQIKPETAELLATQAEAKGLSVDEYLRSLLPHSNGVTKPKEEELTPQEKVRRWREFVEKHSVKGVIADDSRESIYKREDEAL
jgi:hypothetical protein